MLRKFLIPTVVVSLFLLLTTLTNITKATSVTTSISKTATTKPTSSAASILTTTKKPPPPPTTTSKASFVLPSNSSATVLQSSKARKATPRAAAKAAIVKKFLNNSAATVETEITTSTLLPLQPPSNLTSTTLASFKLNQKHQQQQQPVQKIVKPNRQLQDVEAAQQQFHEHLINDNNNANGNNKEIRKKNLDSAFVTVSSAFDVVTPEPTSSTHAYIPFDLDYNDPTEEKAAKSANSRQSTINEVLSNLFPKGFSDIFRFSYADETETETTTPQSPTPPPPPPITVVKSTPTPFKPMPSLKTKKKDKADMPKNATYVRVTTSVTKETRREVRPGHVEIVVEKILTEPNESKSNRDFRDFRDVFRDGSNSISKDELLRINRAAKEASVLPSLLINPQNNVSVNGTNAQTTAPIVILNENSNNDDFVDAPEDDNQIAETQDVVHQVYQPPPPQPPPAESINFHAAPTHQYNVRIIHDDSLRAAQEQQSSVIRNSPSYQSFVEQSKLIQNSLQEAPSRKFLKNFQNPILTRNQNPIPITKGNFHYEKSAVQNHIQTVPSAAQVQYVHQQLQPQAQTLQQEQPQAERYQQLHTQLVDENHNSDKDFYNIENVQHDSTPDNLVFVTISPPYNVKKQTAQYENAYGQEAKIIPAVPIKSPHEFVSNAMAYQHAQPVVNNPKSGTGGGYTFVEVQKSINIHNKLITEKNGRLVEQHETIYPEQKYIELPPQPPSTQEPVPEYVSLSQNPIHVEQEDERHESAASLREEQHAFVPTHDSQDLGEFGTIQQSNLIQETHIVEAPQQLEERPEYYDQYEEHHKQTYNEHEHEEQHEEYRAEQQVEEQHEPAEEVQVKLVDDHLTGEESPQTPPVNIPYTPAIQPVQIPYALPAQELTAPSATPLVVQEILEKHIPVPYGIPEPVGFPVHIQHFIDRPYPVETIVEKPVPYPVETVVEKVVEKHVPVEVEKIIEKPVEKVVKKYIDRPVAIPIKIPIALHIPAHPHGPPPSFAHPPYYGGVTPDYASKWPQTYGGGSYARIPTNILKAYYTKMLKKLVPQMQQAYKSSPPTKSLPKLTPKPFIKPNYKISDILYDLKPPPPRPKGKSTWDVGARYQYDYNTLPFDLSASPSMAVAKQAERQTQGIKTNFDEFQRWRNGHSLKRSPDFGRNLHMEYGFKPPLVPSVEIDDKGVPLKAAADLAKGKEE